MSKSSWRIFLSYRGGSDGETFCQKLYDSLTADPLSQQMFGEIYFSPITALLGDNFDLDIPEIMENVEYFVMPLTAGYFDDFWDEYNNCPDKHSITYKEISAALNRNCKFICIEFPEFVLDDKCLEKLFGKQYNRISTAIKRKFIPKLEEELFRELSDVMTKKDYNVDGMAKFIGNYQNNVHLTFKRDTENSKNFPFYQKLHDVRRITLVNYASSSFITGIDIATIYQESDYLKRWFAYHLSTGKIEADIVLTDPHSSAATDAARYKMYPRGLSVSTEDIILHNLNKLFEFMKNNPRAKLKVYLTRIALPYGVMITEYNDATNNHMKIDLYSAVTNDDGLRPSFYLLQNNKDTSSLYSFFESNVRNIMSNYSYQYSGQLDIEWLRHSAHIIHRGVIKPDLLPHTKSAIEKCIELSYPIEIDLLRIRDGTIIVGREDQDIKRYGYECSLSQLSLSDIRRISRKDPENAILPFEKLLELVNGRIPLLIEIKTTDKGDTIEVARIAEDVVKILKRYFDKISSVLESDLSSYSHNIAIHSSNPYVLKRVKERDCLIPCGIISTDFSDRIDVVGQEFYEMHKECAYLDIMTPDFISYDVRYLYNGIAQKVARQKNIPLVVWTVKDENEQEFAFDNECDSIIIEGAKSY